MIIKFPYYSGDIKNSEALGYISLDVFIEKHKKPSDVTQQLFIDISEAVKNNDIKQKKILKQKLPTFTPSVIIEVGKTRRYANIIGFTGLMQIDLDGIDNEQDAINLKEHIFHEHEEVVCAYLSPSRRGVKFLMRIVVPKSVKHYKALHKSVEDEFKSYGYFDSATKNAILPLFLSNDKDILYREYRKAQVWFRSIWEKETPIRLNDAPSDENSTRDENYKKVVRITTTSINNIIDNGHPQLIKASLILGSRVGAGYIPEHEARYLIENLINSNSYLQKGIKGYVKTAMWGITNGIKNPKYY